MTATMEDKYQALAESPSQILEDPERLLTREELAAFLRVPVGSIKQWGKSPTQIKGPIRMKIGRHIRYRVSDVNDWLNEQRR